MFTYDFLSYDDLLIIGALALFFVVRNWWDLICYGFERSHRPVVAVAATAPRPVAAPPALVRLAAPLFTRPAARAHTRHRAKPHQA